MGQKNVARKKHEGTKGEKHTKESKGHNMGTILMYILPGRQKLEMWQWHIRSNELELPRNDERYQFATGSLTNLK